MYVFKHRLQVIHVKELCHQYSSFFLSPPHFSPLFLGDYSRALFFHLTSLCWMCWFHVFGSALPISHISTSNKFLTSKRIAYFSNVAPINMKSEIVKDERLLISNHLDWSFYLADQKQVLDFALVPCAGHSILVHKCWHKVTLLPHTRIIFSILPPRQDVFCVLVGLLM